MYILLIVITILNRSYRMKQTRYHLLYMDIAHRVALMSHCVRLQCGAVAVKGDKIISVGWNGQPTGFDNCCEDENNVTFDSVLHAESNLITKLARGHESAEGAILYLTHSPCIHCAKLIYQSGITEVFFDQLYRDTEGLDFLQKCGIVVSQLKDVLE